MDISSIYFPPSWTTSSMLESLHLSRFLNRPVPLKILANVLSFSRLSSFFPSFCLFVFFPGTTYSLSSFWSSIVISFALWELVTHRSLRWVSFHKIHWKEMRQQVGLKEKLSLKTVTAKPSGNPMRNYESEMTLWSFPDGNQKVTLLISCNLWLNSSIHLRAILCHRGRREWAGVILQLPHILATRSWLGWNSRHLGGAASYPLPCFSVLPLGVMCWSVQKLTYWFLFTLHGFLEVRGHFSFSIHFLISKQSQVCGRHVNWMKILSYRST